MDKSASNLAGLLLLAFFLGSGAATPVGAQAQEPQKFTLSEAEDYAAQHAYGVRDRDLGVAKARQQIRETAAIGLPQISASLGYTYNAQIRQQPIPAQFIDPNAPEGEFTTLAFGVEHQNVAAVRMDQLLLDASYFVALQASRVLKQTRSLEREAAEIDARKNAAQAYYGVLIANRSIAILEGNLENLRKNLRETQKLYENGFLEEQDADQLELLVNNLENNLKASRRQAQLARQLLKFNLGMPLERSLVLADELSDLLAPQGMGAALTQEEFDYAEHIEYRAIQSQERGAKLQVSNQQAAWYPKLFGSFNHGQSNFTNQFNDAFDVNTRWIPNTSLGVTLSWDVFQGLSRPAKIQKAKLDLQRTQVAKESTRSQLKLEYQRSINNYKQSLDNYKNQKRNLSLSRSIRDKTLRKYQEGINGSLELTQAENQLLETQQSYLDAMQNLLNAKEELENALGQ